MTQTFECPNCRASLVFDDRNPTLTVRCDFCSSTVIVPDSLRITIKGADSEGVQVRNLSEIARIVEEAQIVEAVELTQKTFGVGYDEALEIVDALEKNEVIRLGDTAVRIEPGRQRSDSSLFSTTSSKRSAGCIVIGILGAIVAITLFVAVISLIIPAVSGGAILFGILESQRKSESTAEPFAETSLNLIPVAAATEPVPEPSPTPEFASVVLEFGGQEGTGPGFFNDTRQIGVDGQGNIYTADYDGGRVQVFDSEGRFVDLWTISTDSYIHSMAVDRAGTVYFIEGSDIQRYDPTGKSLGALTEADARFLRGIAVANDGSLAAFGRDRLLRLDPQGQVTLDRDPFSNIEDLIFIHEDIEFNGSGNIYILSSENVLQFDGNGSLIDRIGSQGEGVDQFQTSPLSLAIDGQDRLYVADFGGIMVFDDQGRYLDTIPFRGAVFSMVFNDLNQLVVMDRNGNRVVVYELNR